MPDKVTENEMLDAITADLEAGPIYNALYRLILALGEWQRRARAINMNRRTDFDTSDDALLAAELIEDIRDFGEERK